MHYGAGRCCNAFLVDIGAFLLYNILSYKLGVLYPFLALWV